MKVMIVDDEKDVEILFRQQFRREIKTGQIELCYAFSGQEALEYLNGSQPPDVICILSDINMPGMTGLELLKIVKTNYPNIRVSMITAYGDDYNYRAAMSTGAEHYFTKPIDFSRVKKEIFNFS
ncbi:MAG TPA: response regulator [Bacteroidetes bacterium]|nr:response regulator [Bacteroidota bacterium]